MAPNVVRAPSLRLVDVARHEAAVVLLGRARLRRQRRWRCVR